MSEATNGQTKRDVASLCRSIEEKAKKITHELMPQKILELEQLHKTLPEFNIPIEEFKKIVNLQLQADDENLPPPTKKRKLDEETSVSPSSNVPCNKTIKSLMDILKKELTLLIDMLSTVKIWIQLNIPQIEDGNNFGVGVQEDAVAELGRAESDAFALLETMTRYYVSRAKIVSKMLKYPAIDDYKQAVVEFDEKEYLHLRICTVDLRNNYAILYDLINKNRAKIEKPRSSHNQLLY